MASPRLRFGMIGSGYMGRAHAIALHSAAAKHGQSGDASHASAADIRALMAGGGLDVKR